MGRGPDLRPIDYLPSPSIVSLILAPAPDDEYDQFEEIDRGHSIAGRGPHSLQRTGVLNRVLRPRRKAEPCLIQLSSGSRSAVHDLALNEGEVTFQYPQGRHG